MKMMNLLHNRIFNIVLLVITIGFIIAFFASNFDALREYNPHPDPVFICLSILSAILASLMNAFLWFRLSHSYSMQSDFTACTRAWLISRLGRYVPGKVPFLLFRINMNRDHSPKIVTLATVTEYIASVGAAVIVALLSTLFIAYSNYIPYIWIAGGLFLFVLLIRPHWAGSLINWIFSLTGRKTVSTFPPGNIVHKMTLLGIPPVMLHGLSLFFLFNSLESLSFSLYPVITGVYYTSSLIGLLAFFAPGGIGVREGIMMFIFSHFLDVPTVIVATICIRLVTLFSEFLLIVFFQITARNKHP